MFIRYSITAESVEISQRFAVEVPEAYTPHYNAAPTQLLPIITHDSQKGISFFYWGSPPSLANQKPLTEKIINTRSEIFHEKQMARKKLRERRCVIPADGFYSWKRMGKKSAIPYRYTLKDKSLFAIAGIWEEYDDEHGEMFHTFSILTCVANPSVALTTERMPVILPASREYAWLNESSEDALIALLQPYPESFDFYSISNRVNFADKNDRTIILPAPAADQFGNLSLFD